MKLMTLNTHSLVEPDYERKLHAFAAGILAEMPDVVALQEVNQSFAAQEAGSALLTGYVPAQSAIPVRVDNHAAHAARLLRESGVPCSWTYLPVKVGYGRYDEGLAFLVPGRQITHTESFYISQTCDYGNWKTRRVLGIQAEGLTDWFYTVHMGWWQDAQEPFLAQWRALNAFVTTKPRQSPVWLLGDFNSPAEVRGEGYDRIAAAGWFDAHRLAAAHGSGVTVPGAIDGWRSNLANPAEDGMRIDLIWCSMPARISSSRVIFNGENHPVVSDHFGVIIETLPGAAQTESPAAPWGSIEQGEREGSRRNGIASNEGGAGA